MDFHTLMITGLIVVLIAGFVQGLTSFGFALITVPILVKFIPLQEVVPIVVLLSLCTNLFIFRKVWRHTDLKKIWMLMAASLAAAPIGTYLLLYLDADILKLFTGLSIVVFAGILLMGKSYPLRRERYAYIPVGMASGILNGSISMSGPPVALFLSNQGVSKETFRANLTAYAILLNTVTIVTYSYTGLLTHEVIVYTSWFVPGMFLGVLLGIKAVQKLDDRLFRKLALWLIIVSGCWTVLTVLMQG